MKMITIVLIGLISGCTTIHVNSLGDVVIDAHREVITEAGL